MAHLTQSIRLLSLLAALCLGACASLDGSGLKPGQDSLADVEKTMGKPALRWDNKDGSVQLCYSSQGGPSNLMVQIGPDGKLQSIRNALEHRSFEQIHAGMSQDEVLKILGPSDPSQKIRFPRRNEVAWSWVFQDTTDLAYFIVLFDSEKEIVRTTMIAPFRVIPDFQ